MMPFSWGWRSYFANVGDIRKVLMIKQLLGEKCHFSEIKKEWSYKSLNLLGLGGFLLAHVYNSCAH